MDSTTLIRRLHQHRQWVNQLLLAEARRLTDAQLRQQFAIGQGSLWKTLLHLHAAEFVWLEALLGNEDPLLPGDIPDRLPGNQASANPMESLEELEERWTALNLRWDDYLVGLTARDLDAFVTKKSTSSGKGRTFRTKVCDVLLHVSTHAQYTTAQAVNMLRQIGVTDLPETMLISLARQE